MLKQSISVFKAEPPLIATGHENIKDSSPLVATWKGDNPCTVVKSDSFTGKISVQDTVTKEVKDFDIPTPIQSQKHIAIQFHPAKVGQTLNPGDMLYHSDNIAEDGQLQLGVNALTAFMYYKGYEFEDSMIISEGFAKKLSRLGEHTMHFDIKLEDEIVEVLQPGEIVKSLDRVIKVERPVMMDKSLDRLRSMIVTSEKAMRPLGLSVPNNIVEAMIVDVKYIKVQGGIKNEKMLVDASKKDYKTNSSGRGSEFVERFKNYPARGLQIPDAKDIPEKELKNVAYRVYFKIVIAGKIKEGDKITNRMHIAALHRNMY